jgi:putative ABC transport system substrate-binding protein
MGLLDSGWDYRLSPDLRRGDRPADVPVRRVTRSELVLNVSAARSLGIQIPSALLARADEVI